MGACGAVPGVWHGVEPLLSLTKVISVPPSPIVTNWHKCPPAGRQPGRRTALSRRLRVQSKPSYLQPCPLALGRRFRIRIHRRSCRPMPACPAVALLTIIILVAAESAAKFRLCVPARRHLARSRHCVRFSSTSTLAERPSAPRTPVAHSTAIDGSSLVSKWQFLYAH